MCKWTNSPKGTWKCLLGKCSFCTLPKAPGLPGVLKRKFFSCQNTKIRFSCLYLFTFPKYNSVWLFRALHSHNLFYAPLRSLLNMCHWHHYIVSDFHFFGNSYVILIIYVNFNYSLKTYWNNESYMLTYFQSIFLNVLGILPSIFSNSHFRNSCFSIKQIKLKSRSFKLWKRKHRPYAVFWPQKFIISL